MAQINLRVDDDVKKNAEQVCAELGISMAAAITIYLKKLGREKRIPFEVSVDPFYSPENMEHRSNDRKICHALRCRPGGIIEYIEEKEEK